MSVTICRSPFSVAPAMERINTLSESVSTKPSLPTISAADHNIFLQQHNHVRPDTADAAVMACQSMLGVQQPPRPVSASHQSIQCAKSVEEVLELKPTAQEAAENKAAALQRTLKTNNFFVPAKLMRSNKTSAATCNSLATSPVILTKTNQNGSPGSATSPAQSVLILPNDPPTNSTTCDHGDIASIQNGKIGFYNDGGIIFRSDFKLLHLKVLVPTSVLFHGFTLG